MRDFLEGLVPVIAATLGALIMHFIQRSKYNLTLLRMKSEVNKLDAEAIDAWVKLTSDMRKDISGLSDQITKHRELNKHMQEELDKLSEDNKTLLKEISQLRKENSNLKIEMRKLEVLLKNSNE